MLNSRRKLHTLSKPTSEPAVGDSPLSSGKIIIGVAYNYLSSNLFQVKKPPITLIFFLYTRLTDYLIVHTMHTLAVNSVSMLLSYLVTHSKCNFIPDAMKPHLNAVSPKLDLIYLNY